MAIAIDLKLMATTENKEIKARRVVHIPIRRRIVTHYREGIGEVSPTPSTPAFYQEQNRQLANQLSTFHIDPNVMDRFEEHIREWRADLEKDPSID